jgi:TolB-like protein/DNA-binding winged helix-turn-helix (wHTH) protein/Tfp pilus assembly protein PilF
MAPQAGTKNNPDFSSDPAGYQVDDLIIDLAPRRVRRSGTVIPLKSLSFDLLVTLVRAAPNLLSFEQLSERVWPGLVVSPETIVQRVKLLRTALGDDPHAPRYIEGVRGRGYRMVAEVRPLLEKSGTPESIVPPALKETKDEESPNLKSSITTPEAASASSPSALPPAASRPGPSRRLGWVGGAMILVMLLVASGAILYQRRASKPPDRAGAEAAAAAIHSLAVLPLENLSGDKGQEYFADGMTDALTTDLAQIGALRVISRTSAMQFKASRETLPQIGRDLQVDAVVEGAVTRSEDRVRVTAQLVEASSDRHLWARTYERDLKDILALQDEIAGDIADQVRVKLTPKERSLLIQAHAVDPEAYDAYLMGMYWADQWTLGSGEKACDYFRKALAKDPNYAPAYAGVANCFGPEATDKARAAVVKALALDPSLAEGHRMLAMAKLFLDWDFSGAEGAFKEAIALNPNFAPAHRWYSTELVALGRLDEARAEAERARDLDPYSADVTEWLGQALYHARRYDDALGVYRRGLEMHPDVGRFYLEMADIYEQKQMLAEAFEARQHGLRLDNDPRVAALADAYKHSGYKGYLLKLAEFEQTGVPGSIVTNSQPFIDEITHNSAWAVHIYALLNDQTRAIAALEESYAKRSPGVLFMRTAPEMDSIRSLPGFRDLIRRVGFPSSTSEKN